MDKKLISAAAGLISYGALVGWAVTADHWEQKSKAEKEVMEGTEEYLRAKIGILEVGNLELREEVRKQEKYIRDSQENDTVLPDLLTPDMIAEFKTEKPPEGETDETPVTDEEGEVDEEELEEQRTNLRGLIEEYSKNPDQVEFFVETGQTMENDNRPPFLIPQEEFAWSEQGSNYDKNTLTYFPQHRILLDEDKEPIEDVATTVGWRNLSRFGEESGHPDVVFVRNHRLATDFEIERTEDNLPVHVRYGMGQEEFKTRKAAGLLRLRPEDRD